ncbi:hypothetical protein WJ16_07645 [Burkholderia metallica]|nr:hypothetical protein WJ16_07645 [Burkholderia metallica]
MGESAHKLCGVVMQFGRNRGLRCGLRCCRARIWGMYKTRLHAIDVSASSVGIPKIFLTNAWTALVCRRCRCLCGGSGARLAVEDDQRILDRGVVAEAVLRFRFVDRPEFARRIRLNQGGDLLGRSRHFSARGAGQCNACFFPTLAESPSPIFVNALAYFGIELAERGLAISISRRVVVHMALYFHLRPIARTFERGGVRHVVQPLLQFVNHVAVTLHRCFQPFYLRAHIFEKLSPRVEPVVVTFGVVE